MLNWLTGGILTKIGIVALVLMAGTIFYLHTQNVKLQTKVDNTTQNIKSINFGTKVFKNDSGQWQATSIEQNKTIAQLKQDKDSINLVNLKLAKQLKLKPKEITEIGQVDTKLIHDTSTIFIPHKDTTYDFSVKPYVTNKVKIKGDSISNDLQVSNDQSLVWHTKRETIDPPKSFFLLRWFQKRQTITYIDIINSNKLIRTTQQSFQIINK